MRPRKWFELRSGLQQLVAVVLMVLVVVMRVVQQLRWLRGRHCGVGRWRLAGGMGLRRYEVIEARRGCVREADRTGRQAVLAALQLVDVLVMGVRRCTDPVWI